MSDINEQRTVTLPLEEYLVMKENAEQLTKAINERKIIGVGSGISNDWIRYYITDEHTAIMDVKQEVIENKHMYERTKKELDSLREQSKRNNDIDEKRYIDLWKKYNNASLLTRIIRVFNKQY
jgi:ribose 5-phosphate isomerase